MFCHHGLHAVLERGSGVYQLVSMRIGDHRQDTGQEAVGTVSYSDYHRFSALIHVLYFEALLDRPVPKVPVIPLHVSQEVFIQCPLVGDALVGWLVRI